MMLFITFSDSR